MKHSVNSLRRIALLFRPYRGQLAAVGALIVASTLVSLVSPFLLREILDGAIPQGRTGLLTVLTAGMIVVVVANNVASVWQSYLSTIVGQRIMHDLRSAVYTHLQRMSLAFFTRTRTGEVQSRIANDIGGMQSTVTSTATSLVSNVTTVLASVIAMAALDWRLTVVSLLMLPVFSWISRRIGRERKEFTYQRQVQMALMSSIVEESLSVSGIMLGRIMGRSRALTEEFARESDTLVELQVRSSMAGRWRQSSIYIMMAAMPSVIYWAAGLTAVHGHTHISIGTLVAFTTLQQGLFTPTLQLLQTGIALQSSLALFDRIFEYLDLPVDIEEPTTPRRLREIDGAIRFHDVEFSYDGSTSTLSDINLDIPPGSTLAVVGETGAGKTTLGYLVPRLYDVTGGCVSIDGVDVRDLSFDTLAAAVGTVSQETYLFHSSVIDNLRFAKPNATEQEIFAATDAAQIHSLIVSLPDGYETLVGERGYRFSGGEKQRLAIARTILRNPPVIIMDEATSSLDTHTEDAVQQALDELSKGRTSIIIAHRLSTIRNADQIVVVDKGKIVECGTHDELLALGRHYAALVNKDGGLVSADARSV